MSVDVSSLVWQSDVSPVNDRMILLAMAENANDRGVCWPGTAYVVGKTTLSRSTVFRRLAKLEEEGLLERRERRRSSGGRRSNVYRINLAELRRRARTVPDDETAELEELFATSSQPASRPAPDGTDATGCQPWTPHAGGRSENDRGCHSDTTPVSQLDTTPRVTGDTYKEPSLEPSLEPSNPGPAERIIDAAASDTGDAIDDTSTAAAGEPREAKGPGLVPSVPGPPPDFEAFWEIYPKAARKAKGAARKAWDRAVRSVLPATIMKAVRAYDAELAATGRQEYTKHPATWLNAGCWDDEPTPIEVIQQRNGRLPAADLPEDHWRRRVDY